MELFAHLPQIDHRYLHEALATSVFRAGASSGLLPPAVQTLGMHFADRSITGARARCLALLQCLRQVIEAYVVPPEKSFARDLTARINTYVQFLIDCRPLSVGMGNAVKSLKQAIAQMGVRGLPESEAREEVLAHIDRYVSERLVMAANLIVELAVEKIQDGDVILTHAQSFVVAKILEAAFDKGRKFRVVVVDSRPALEGRATLRRLLRKGISCTYTHMGAVSYAMREASKVILGAAAVMANGTMLSRLVRLRPAHANARPLILPRPHLGASPPAPCGA